MLFRRRLGLRYRRYRRKSWPARRAMYRRRRSAKLRKSSRIRRISNDYTKETFSDVTMYVLLPDKVKPERPSSTSFEMFTSAIGTDSMNSDRFGFLCTVYKYVKFNSFVWHVTCDPITAVSGAFAVEKTVVKGTVSGLNEFFKNEDFYVSWDLNFAYDASKAITVKDLTGIHAKKTRIGGHKPAIFKWKVPQKLREYVLCSEVPDARSGNVPIGSFFNNLLERKNINVPNYFIGCGTEIMRKLPNFNNMFDDVRFVLRVNCFVNCTFHGAVILKQ
ncbi:putative capsid protein [Longjawed orbweaver circular virus 1]|uniref:Putative capsid protein n=1 Tax=Longjawed orbweaver circular virus 1 TaxID=2293294 RepID=A0A346BPA7_9VIRU|nr:putative capsid protein [Longjawed orbweaver circular virus 1]AXL65904.1 putative capsid protein [Longjawed orbweaver circular virus 1]